MNPVERQPPSPAWNDTQSDYPRDLCLHALFEAQAGRTPDAVAVRGVQETLSYRELDARAQRVSGRLRELGVGPDDLVGIWVERSPNMVAAVLGVLKSGGAYVPIDPTLPSDRIAFMLEDARVKALITHPSLVGSLGSVAAPVVLLEEVIASPPGAAVEPARVGPGNLAYVRYTSGSTGKPKGVQIEHRAIVNFISSMQRTPGITADDVLLAVTTLSFDISELEIHLPLVSGAQVVVVPWETISSGQALVDALEKFKVTIMQATPATWRLMLEAGWSGTAGLKILCGGEGLPSDLARQLLPRCGELWNMYGPTETTVWSTCCRITDASDLTIGRPIANTDVHILDDQLRPLDVGGEGELLIGGDGVARGYHHRPELTAEKFIPHPFKPGQRLYRTGDLARYKPDGRIECLGRLDFQIKINGFRIEPGEIEALLAAHKGVRQAVVVAREDRPGEKRLVAYYSVADGAAPTTTELRSLLQGRVPAYMVPAAFVPLGAIPLNSNGKVDRKALPKPSNQRPALARDFVAPRGQLEIQLAELWRELLGLDQVGVDDTFFELGGTSLLAVQMTSAWRRITGQELPVVKVFQFPTVACLVGWMENRGDSGDLVGDQERRAARFRASSGSSGRQTPIAIIGLAGRFPGANDVATLWKNLCEGVESITVFPREEMGVGIDESLRYDPDYIPARGIIADAELFDAGFFGIGALEASVMDPQQRVFLELAYTALENAGYDPERPPGPVGVYAGVGDNRYFSINLQGNPKLLARAGKLAVEYGNEKDYVALRVAYALNLTGPAVSSNTACSTTLLTIDEAARGLANFECDVALAGGIDIGIPQKSGFFYEEGGTFSRDGHCRPFDAEATGTMFCDGAGIVVLRRLDEAIAAGDKIYAVIAGSAKNNNGARTASFLAPSVEGQAEVIAMAQANAGVPVESIGYVEAHGTGTPVGDPIEVEALSKVFDAKTKKRQFCYLGSIKGNIGHPTNAAGVAGVIKTALVLHHGQIPATLHFRNPNPRIDFASSCFRVADRLIPFPRTATPRRAAVSSFGFGGTNVHAVLEEAPAARPPGPSLPVQLVVVSARTPQAVAAYADSLASHFTKEAEEVLADAASTLARGRKQWPHRRFVVAADRAEAAALLRQPHPLRSGSGHCTRRNPPVVFLFGGQGTQYVNMGHNLYRTEPLFRAIVDECCGHLRPHLGRDLRDLLYPAKGDEDAARESLRNTVYTQPALFTIEYALARWWQGLGVQPTSMVGHSIGEFVAATIAGVFDLPDVLRIVAARGRLMQGMPGGSMLSVRAAAADVEKLLVAGVQMAAVNSPSLCVVAGPVDAVAAIQKVFEARGWACRELLTSHAFHSEMMDPMLEPLRREFDNVTLRPPTLALMSTVTGATMTQEQACSPEYWTRQARMPVLFSSAIKALLETGHDLFLECGPRATLSTLTRQHAPAGVAVSTVPCLGDSTESNAELYSLLTAVGSLWTQGVAIDWEALYANEDRRRVPLPTYPFERQRHWVEPAAAVATEKAPVQTAALDAGRAAAAASLEAAEPVPSAETHPSPAENTRRDRIVVRLREIIGQISGIEAGALRTSATFFELGLDSLALVQVTSAIRNELGQKVGFSQLMNQVPTIDMLAAHLEGILPAEAFAAPVEAPREAPRRDPGAGAPAASDADLRKLVEEQGRMIARLTALLEKGGAGPECSVAPVSSTQGPIPATVPQRGIFLSSRLSDQLSAAYNESITLFLKGTIDVEAIARSVRRLSERHDALRATFDDGGQRMTLGPRHEPTVTTVDLTSLEASARPARLDAAIASEGSTPFRLPEGPLFRAVVVVLDSGSAALILTAHHVICDGWALDVLIHDFCHFYSKELGGSPKPLLPVASYGEYARMSAARLASDDFAASRRYYEQRFAEGFPVLVLPTRAPRPGLRSFAAKRDELIVPPQTLQELRTFAASHESSIFAVVLAAYSLLLARISGQRHFVIALPTAEQPGLGQLNLVGHCVNMLPFEVDLRSPGTVGSFVRQVQAQLSSGYDHAAYTITHLLERLRPANPHVGIRPVSVGLTSLKKWKLSDLPQHGFAVDFDVNPRQFESFEFYLMALERQDDLVLRYNFSTALFDAPQVSDWLRQHGEILASLAANPGSALDEVVRFDKGGSLTQEVRYVFQNASQAAVPEVPKAIGADTPSLRRDDAPLEDQLIGIWKRTLRTESIGPDDNFFDIGGHSLIAAELFATIERELGRSLPLSILFGAPTPRALARAMSQSGESIVFQNLVPIRAKGSRRPLFLIHGAEGNVLIYRSLASHLGEDQPVYGLQADGVDGGPIGDTRFETVARRYLQEIRKVQPKGPYMFGGYCLGGTIALEMAQQLREVGEEVSIIAMFENYNLEVLGWPMPLHIRLSNAALNVLYHLLNVVDAPRGSRLPFIREKARVEWARVRLSARHALRKVAGLFGMSKNEAHHMKVGAAYDAALAQYHVRPYGGAFQLFLPRRRFLRFQDPLGGWKSIAPGRVELISLESNPRGSMVEPHVRELAAALRKRIESGPGTIHL